MINPWNPITKEEMIAFIGVNIAIGVVQLLAGDDYWSVNPILAYPWFRSVFSSHRFRQILQYLHVTDNSQAVPRGNSDYDKLWKVRYLIDAFALRCVQLYDPHPQLSVDESMIGFQADGA